MKLYQSLILAIFLSFAITLSKGDQSGDQREEKLTCFFCDDEISCNKNNQIDKRCWEISDSCLTIFNENNKVIKRGCYSSYIKYCQDNTKNKCYECNSDLCNKAYSKDEYIKCYNCTTFDNPKCSDVNDVSSVPIRECRESCMSTLKYLDDKKIKFQAIRSCLDDKNEEERKKCNDKNFCEACNKDFCNGGVYPKHRLRCIHCSGSHCKNPGPNYSKFCENIEENDKCMIEYSGFGIIKKFGCLSDLNKEDINDMLINNTLHICDGTNCNTALSEDWNTCYKCVSANIRECITDVKNSGAVGGVFCHELPNQKCYTKFNSLTGSVERGCWARLDQEERAKCLDESNQNCKLCTEKYCNYETIPNDRKSCLACNSTADPDCHESPKKKGLCFNYKEDDKCIVKYVDGVTIRGCSSDIGTCDALDHYSCQICSGENCNKANLKFISLSNKNLGIWQDLPLKCKYCTSIYRCSDLSEIKTTTCPNNNDECITIFNDDRKVEYRGCSSILNNEYTEKKWKLYCETNPEFCPQCKSNECNIANSTRDYVKCHYCGWPDYKSCNEMKEEILFPTRQCYKSCMTAAYKKTQDLEDPVYNVMRTCLDDKEPQQQIDCKSNQNENCQVCETNNCNSKMLFGNWSSCHTCQGSEECKTPLLKQCESYKKNDNCFYLYSDNKEIIKGGCMSELSAEVRKNLIINNKVSFCRGSNCNEDLPKDQKCVKCDSSKDEKCATEPESYKELENCTLPNSNCYVKVVNGTNIRGCMSSLGEKMLDCIDSEDCLFCNSDQCNNVIYPPNRQKCFVCDSANNEDCHEKPSTAKVCPVYLKDQKCVSKYDEGKTERGCSNELTCDEKDVKKCQICSDENCNTMDLKGLNNSATIVANSMLIGVLVLLRNYLS
ncbi:uncharacterized protein LOC129615761 [Condylostylus longicornis]|uniref:uncharacterized protein LOC129615761 n=1 Tax=Condylostylus longicornis TaxID=2530218 RepID=UPI00244DDC30|nr:uncharacterized protein LOC129615761 [Condylostylus longicornis]